MIWRVFPGIDLTDGVHETTLHGRMLWPHPDQDGDGVEDLLSTAGGLGSHPDTRRGAFDLISSGTGEILAGGEFGAGVSWEFFCLPAPEGEAPVLASYSLSSGQPSHLRVHRWAIQEEESVATFVSTLCAEIPLPGAAIGEHHGWIRPKLLRTKDSRRAYLACDVDYRRCLLQLSGDPLAPSLSMAWPWPDRPWLPEPAPEVAFHWAVLPDLDSDGFEELVLGPADLPRAPSEQQPDAVGEPKQEPPESLLVLSGKDLHVLRAIELPRFRQGDLVALASGKQAAQMSEGRENPLVTSNAAAAHYTLFAYCEPLDGNLKAGTILRIDPGSGRVDSTLSARLLDRNVDGSTGSWEPVTGGDRDQSLLWADGSRPLLIFGNPDVLYSGGATCIDPNTTEVLWTAGGRAWGEMMSGDYNFGATSCALRSATGQDLVAIASPYIRGGQASISFFRLLDGHCTLRIDCHGGD
jgi:hypothetical protein